MKKLFFVAGFLLMACGKISTSGTGIGEMRLLTVSSVATGDLLIYDSICSALTRKSQKLGSGLMNLNFDVQIKDCDGNNVVFATQQVSVEPANGSYALREKASNSLFVFPKVETPSDGIFASICGKTDLKVPMILDNKDAMWVSTSGSCPSAGGEQCLTVELGSPSESTANGATYYKIHTREFIRFNLQPTNGKYGFFTYRRKLSDGACSGGKSSESIATWR